MPDTLPPGAKLADRYTLGRVLGRGGMGVVYEARDERTGDSCAVKLLHGGAKVDRTALARFQREARAATSIDSEHVVRVLDTGTAPEIDGAPFLVMELLDGSDLEALVRAQGRLPPSDVVAYLAQAAAGLDRAHAQGIVHRDLKPENLFLHRRADGTSIVKILDFGLSKLVETAQREAWAGTSTTTAGAFVGTPLYMAPEQLRARAAEISARTDVWAMGLIALHLFTGEPYWRADSMADLVVEILAEPMAPPSRKSPWLSLAFDEWFATSCARDPAARFASVGEQIAALRAIAGGPR